MEDESSRRAAVQSGVTDYHRWSQDESFEIHWAPRAAFAAAALLKSRWIADLGCGKQSVRALLPGKVYLPSDLAQHTLDTLRIDINRNLYPDAHLQVADTVTLWGVLEFLYSPPEALRRLRTVERLALSYCPTDLATDADRTGCGWVNALSVAELVATVQGAGWIVESLSRIDSWQVVLTASNPEFGFYERATRWVRRFLDRRPTKTQPSTEPYPRPQDLGLA